MTQSYKRQHCLAVSVTQDLPFWILPLWRGQNSNFKGQLYKQDIGVFIFHSKHRHKQQGSSGWFMRWECFFELYVRWELPFKSGEEHTAAVFSEELSQWLLPRWSQLLGTQNEVLSFHSLSLTHIQSQHTREGHFSFIYFPEELFLALSRHDTKQATELCFMYRNSLLEYKELLVIVTEDCWLIPGALQYSWGIIIDFSFLPTGIVLVISHCSCKARRLILLKSHLGSLHGRCCMM